MKADLRKLTIACHRLLATYPIHLNVEREYIAVSPDGSQALVELQEANSVAILETASTTITAIKPLGRKVYSLLRNSLDASSGLVYDSGNDIALITVSQSAPNQANGSSPVV